MKQLAKAIVEVRMLQIEAIIDILMDEFDRLVVELESFIPEPPPELQPESKTKQELLEEEFDELISIYGCSVNIVQEGNMTIAATLEHGEDCPKIGIAKCCPTDEFDEAVGNIVALKRALGIPVDPEQYGTPKVVKNCENCKHEEVGIFEEPCFDCEGSNLWEAVAEVEKDCDTCKYDKDISIHQEPCKACLAYGNKPICWEPIEEEEEDDCEECTACGHPCEGYKAFLIQRPDIAKEIEKQSKQEVPVEKRCLTCEYSDLNLFAQPCFGCLNGAITKKGDRPNWKAKETSKKTDKAIETKPDFTKLRGCGHCVSCKYLATSLFAAPCNVCSHMTPFNDIGDVDAWEPRV